MFVVFEEETERGKEAGAEPEPDQVQTRPCVLAAFASIRQAQVFTESARITLA